MVKLFSLDRWAAAINIFAPCKNDHRIKWMLAFLFFFDLFVGLSLINEGIFHHDGVVLAQAVEGTYRTGQLQPAICGRYGAVLVNSILYFPFFLQGVNADMVIRLSSVLFHAFAGLAFFLFVYELFRDRVQAFVGALFLSFTPFFLAPNTHGKEHGMAMFFLLFSFYLLHRGIRKGSLFQVALASVLYVYSISVREAMLAMAPLYFLLFLCPRISFRPFRLMLPEGRLAPRLLASVALPFLGAFLFLFWTYLWPVFYRMLFVTSTNVPSFLGPFSRALAISAGDLCTSVPGLFVVYFIVGIREMFRKEDRFLAVFFLAWTMFFFFYGNLDGYTARYLDIVVIPIYVFSAYCLAWLYRRYKVITGAIVMGLVWIMFMSVYHLLVYRHDFNGPKRFAMAVEAATEKNAVIIAQDEWPFIEYYAHRKVILPPVRDLKKIGGFIGSVQGYLEKGVPVYVIGSAYAYNAQALREKVDSTFRVAWLGSKLTEGYHKADIQPVLYYQNFYKLDLRDGRQGR